MLTCCLHFRLFLHSLVTLTKKHSMLCSIWTQFHISHASSCSPPSPCMMSCMHAPPLLPPAPSFGAGWNTNTVPRSYCNMICTWLLLYNAKFDAKDRQEQLVELSCLGHEHLAQMEHAPITLLELHLELRLFLADCHPACAWHWLFLLHFLFLFPQHLTHLLQCLLLVHSHQEGDGVRAQKCVHE